MKTGAVIIAAGHKLVGSTFQPVLPVGDSTAIRRIIITLKSAGVNPVVVVTGQNGDELEKHIANLQVISLRNKDYEKTQMFYSICMGLNYLEDLCDRVFLLPAKFPMFLPETIEKMMESQAELTYPVFEGRKGHPVLVSAGLVDKILSYDGPGGLNGVLRQLEEIYSVREISVEDKGIIFPIETDADSLISFVKEQRIQVHPKVQLSLGRNDSFFGPSLAQFLTLIDHTGSMQTACRQMHMSYTKGWKILREAEKQLGYPLLLTQSGGAEGGFSQLTPKTKEFLGHYLNMEEALRKEGERLFRLHFSQELKEQK